MLLTHFDASSVMITCTVLSFDADVNVYFALV